MLAKGQIEKLENREAFKNTPDLHQNDAIMRKKLSKFFEGIEDVLTILEHLPERQIKSVISPDDLKAAFRLSEALLPYLEPPQIRLKDKAGRFVAAEGVKLLYLDPPEENAVYLSDGEVRTRTQTFGPSVSWRISPEEYNVVATVARHIGALRSAIIPTRETLPGIGLVEFQGKIVPDLRSKHADGFRAQLDFLMNIGGTDLEAIIAFFENNPVPPEPDEEPVAAAPEE
jgi:hypothetical protein